MGRCLFADVPEKLAEPLADEVCKLTQLNLADLAKSVYRCFLREGRCVENGGITITLSVPMCVRDGD